MSRWYGYPIRALDSICVWERYAIGHFIRRRAALIGRSPSGFGARVGSPLERRFEHLASVVAVTPDGKRALCSSRRDTRQTPDSKRAVSVSWDHTLKMWDIETGRLLLMLKDTGNLGVAVSPDGKRAVFTSWDDRVKVWDLETGEIVAVFYCDGSPDAATLSMSSVSLRATHWGASTHLSLEA